MNGTEVLTETVVALSIAAMMLRPLGWPEAIWPVAGAIVLVVCRALPLDQAIHAVLGGADIYCFLLGMMLIAELAREAGLFDYVAGSAVRLAGRSQHRLFLIVYALGVLVTTFLSNDATAVVLTPAVLATARAAKSSDPRPLLLACALVSNAASFVLPISNPANLVLFAGAMPSLLEWLRLFALPSLAAATVTLAGLWWLSRRALADPIDPPETHPELSREGRVMAATLLIIALALMIASSQSWSLGLTTLSLAVIAFILFGLSRRAPPWAVLGNISYAILPLVAGLFVLVAALQAIGLVHLSSHAITVMAQDARGVAPLIDGFVVAALCNLANNLPVGLLTAAVVAQSHLEPATTRALAIAVDLGPNFSVTGSLATILWLMALRREQVSFSAIDFLKVGMVVTPPALVAAILIGQWV